MIYASNERELIQKISELAETIALQSLTTIIGEITARHAVNRPRMWNRGTSKHVGEGTPPHRYFSPSHCFKPTVGALPIYPWSHCHTYLQAYAPHKAKNNKDVQWNRHTRRRNGNWIASKKFSLSISQFDLKSPSLRIKFFRIRLHLFFLALSALILKELFS